MKDIVTRFVIVFILSVFWVAYRIFYIREDKFFMNYKECVYDYVLDEIFSPLTEFMSQNLNSRDLLLIICGSLTDFYLLYFLIAVYKSYKNFKPLLQIFMFYFVKLLLDQIFRFKIISEFLFEEPGYPSLIFDYTRTPYTFYSEYSGLPIILAAQFEYMGYGILFKFGLIISVLNSITVILLRKNSVIDVIFGIITAHYCYLLTEKINLEDNSKILIENIKHPQKCDTQNRTITIENKIEIENSIEMT